MIRNSFTPTLINLAPAASTDAVRWMFQHWGRDLHESLHVPVFHLLPLALEGTSNDRRPLVVHEGAKFRGEADIALHFDAQAPAERRLIPDGPPIGSLRADVMRETTHAHRVMRPNTVRLMYWHLLQDRDLVWNSFTLDAPWYEGFLAVPLFGFIRWGLTANLGLSAEAAVAARGEVMRAFDRAAAILADGRPYLCGDRFTLADLTFAASAAPVVLAKGYQGNLPRIEALPEDLRQIVESYRAHPTGGFVQRLYDTRRLPKHRSAPRAAPLIEAPA